jgi:sulfur-oxidizing protein SoxX
MQKSTLPVLAISAALLGAVALVPVAQAAGKAPETKVCANKDNPPTDPVTQGGCVVVDRSKGNCMACHQIAGVSSGDIGTKLENVAARYPGADGKKTLRAQIEDPRKLNPNTVMPPFGAHGILTPDEIDKVVEFVLSL